MQVGLGFGSFQTTLRFDGDREVDVEMNTVSLSGAWLINSNWTGRVSVGVILDGDLTTGTNATYGVEPGGLVAVGLEHLVHVGEGLTPSVDLSFFLSGSWTQTVAPATGEKTDYRAADARLGARAGWNVGDNTFPYVAARVFGGPVSWELDGEDVTGTDIHHYQLALGAATRVGSFSIWAEWAGLGEQALGAGVSTSW